jgi:hypothetical protein
MFLVMAPPKITKADFPFTFFSMEADKDYLLARMIHFTGGAIHSRAGFFAQQACEKYMKALSVQETNAYIETHKLLDLAAACEPFDAYFSQQDTKRVLDQFDMFDQVGRYGGAANFDPMSKGKMISGAQFHPSPTLHIAGAFVWQGSYLFDLDAFVFNVRRDLNFQKQPGLDGLKSVVENNKNSYLVATWHFPVSLHQILIHQNAYFTAVQKPLDA